MNDYELVNNPIFLASSSSVPSVRAPNVLASETVMNPKCAEAINIIQNQTLFSSSFETCSKSSSSDRLSLPSASAISLLQAMMLFQLDPSSSIGSSMKLSNSFSCSEEYKAPVLLGFDCLDLNELRAADFFLFVSKRLKSIPFRFPMYRGMPPIEHIEVVDRSKIIRSEHLSFDEYSHFPEPSTLRVAGPVDPLRAEQSNLHPIRGNAEKQAIERHLEARFNEFLNQTLGCIRTMQNHTDGGGSSRATKKRVREVDDTQKENGGVSGSLRWDHVLMLASMQQEKSGVLAKSIVERANTRLQTIYASTSPNPADRVIHSSHHSSLAHAQYF